MKRILLPAFFLLIATQASQAATFQANLTGINFSYTSQQSSYTVTNITTDLPGFDSSKLYLAICFDFTRRSYWEVNGNAAVNNLPINEEITTDLTVANIFNDTPVQNEAQVVAFVGYLVDNFFISKFVNGNSTTRAAFAQVVWELTLDAAITGRSLSFSTDDFDRDANANFNVGTTLRTEMDSMLTAVNTSGVTASYTWLTPHFLINENDTLNQDYLLIPVPEMSSSFLALLSVAFGLTRRRR